MTDEETPMPNSSTSGCAYGSCGLLPGGIGVCLCKFLLARPDSGFAGPPEKDQPKGGRDA